MILPICRAPCTVTIQMGGSDQWGNITAGTEYNRKIGGEPHLWIDVSFADEKRWQEIRKNGRRRDLAI